MQTQMTERDKKLIVFLAIFVLVVAGGYWGVYPAVSKIISINMEIQDAEAERDENEMKLAQLLLVETENQNIESEIATARADFFPVMTSDQVDKYVTELILDYNLYAYDLNIIMPTEEAEVNPYQYSAKAALQETTEAQIADSGIENAEEIQTGIYEVSVTVRVGGEREHIQQLIDDLSATEQKLHLNSYSWGSERSISYNEDGTYEVDTNQTMTMTIHLYMCEE